MDGRTDGRTDGWLSKNVFQPFFSHIRVLSKSIKRSLLADCIPLPPRDYSLLSFDANAVQLPTKYDRQFFIGPFENYTCINLLS